MDIEKLKAVLGADFDELSAHVAALTEQRDKARQESIKGRQTLKDELAAKTDLLNKVFEKAGVENFDEFDALPPGKATAEANRVIELRAKNLQAKLDEAAAKLGDVEGRWKGERLNSALNTAVTKHAFIDTETAIALLRPRSEFVGDEIMYKTDTGDLVPIAEAAAGIAKAKPFLVQASGFSGSGAPGSQQQRGMSSMTRASFEALTPDARMVAIKAGTQVN